MATRKPKSTSSKSSAKTKAPLKRNDMIFFQDHDDQDNKDLAYGAQQTLCKDAIKRNAKSKGYTDPSNSGDWTPETD